MPMTHNLCFVLALCVGQAGGSSSPYNPLYTPSSYQAPILQQATAQPAYQPAAVQPAAVQPTQPAAAAATATPAMDLQVDKKYENKVGHEQDYSWVTGHLFYVHTDGGRWVVRYAMPGEVDKFGGSIVLAPGVEMKNFREG